MENQHKKIKGYRDLSQSEINLMNQIKEHAQETQALLHDVKTLRNDMQREFNPIDSNQYEESMRCLELAKTNLQTGQMWFVRAVALPNSF